MKIFKKLILGVLTVACVPFLVINEDVTHAEQNSNSLYDNYNLERTQKSAIEYLARQNEVNAILSATRLKEWDMFNSEAEKLGNYESVDKLFELLGDSLSEHQDFYKKYQENMVKPIEEQEDLRLLEPIDYLSVSNVKIDYYFDSKQQQLSQIVTVTSEQKVYRCLVVYDSKGNIVNYLEV